MKFQIVIITPNRIIKSEVHETDLMNGITESDLKEDLLHAARQTLPYDMVDCEGNYVVIPAAVLQQSILGLVKVK